MSVVAAELSLATPGDLGAIAEFLLPLGGPSFGDRFPGATPQEFYCWKYFKNPLGDAIVAIATAGDSVVSVVAAVPKHIWVAGRTVTAYELGDFLTREDYRKQGLFSRSIELVCSEAGKHGAQLVYVRPNDISFPILANHLSFLEAQRVVSRRYRVPSHALWRKARVPTSISRTTGIDVFFRRFCLPQFRENNVRVVRVERFGDETDDFWRVASQGYEFAIVRDKAYLNWRFADCPTPYKIWQAMRNGQTAGFLVASVNGDKTMGSIIDFFTDRNDVEAARALLSTSMSNLLNAGVGTISTWALQGSAHSAPQALLKRSFPFRNKKHLHLAFRMLAAAEVSLPSTPLKWHFTLGDSDGV